MIDRIKLFGALFLSGACIGKAMVLAEKIGRIESANDIEKKISDHQDVKFPSGRMLKFKHYGSEEEA